VEPEVSYSLSILSKNKIVGTNSIGRERVYYLYSEQLEPLLTWLDSIFSGDIAIKAGKDNKK
jgi:type III secretory pathway lipoprotein EscJ